MKMTAADIIYHNGYIYTADAENRVAGAIAIADGRILACGEMMTWQHSVVSIHSLSISTAK